MPRLVFPHSYLIIIRRYMEERGRRCFTYRGLRKWLYRQPEYRDLEWHTVERAIRRLAEEKFIVRKRGKGNKVFFCWDEGADEAMEFFR